MIKYHFFGKECSADKDLSDYSDVVKNLEKQNFASKFPPVFVRQVHGADVLVIDNESKITNPQNRVDADAIVTNIKDLVIGLVTADCMPILFYDEKNSVIAMAHAGWQGAFKNITDNTIDEMLKIGAEIDNIKIIIGPCIRQSSYEVDIHFYERFLHENSDDKKFFIASVKLGHYLFDLPSYVKEKIKKRGIKNISDDAVDTYSEQNLSSFRRCTHLNEADKHRNISVMQII